MQNRRRTEGKAGRRAVALVLLCALCPGGCMVGPDYERPTAALNEDWLQDGDPRLRTGTAEDVTWWSSFQDPVLDSLVEEAHAQNLGLRQAAVRVMQAMAARGIAVGELFPQSQQLGGGFDRTRYSENPENPLGTYRNTWSVGFDAAWELDLWGRFRRNIESADAVLDATLASYDDVMVSLLAEVAATYVQLRTLQVRRQIARENIGIQEESLKLAESRHRNGLTSELDVTDGRSALEQTRSTLPAIEAQLKQAMYRLDFLLGSPPRDLSERLGEAAAVPSPPDEVAVGVPADLLRRRPDVRLAERVAAARSAQIGVARADLFPAFFLGGSLGFQSDSSGSLLERDSLTGTIGSGFQWPIFNYGRLTNNVRVQDAIFQAAILDYQNAVLAAAQEVESALAAFLGTQEQARHLENSLVAARRSLALATTRYREGSSTFTRVLDAQFQLQQVQESLAVVQGQAAQALIATYKALGGGWQVRLGLDILPEDTRRQMEERTDWGSMLEPNHVEGRDFGVIPRHDPSQPPAVEP